MRINYDEVDDAMYIRFSEEEVGVPITLVSLGPDRTETVSQ